MWVFFAALIVLCAFTGLMRDARLAGTSAILLTNWLLCTVVVAQTGDAYPWTWFFAVDYLSAFTILALLGKPTRWQSGVGMIYAGQLVCHAARGMYLHSAAALYYGYYVLKWASWAQVAIIAAWGAYEMAHGRWVLGSRASPPIAGTAGIPRTPR